MAKLLIVDDEPNVLNALRRMCLNHDAPPAISNPQVMTFTSPVKALEYLQDHPVDLIISDFRMPEMDGATFLTEARKLQANSARIIISAHADIEGIMRAINVAGIFQFVSKPWSDHELKGGDRAGPCAPRAAGRKPATRQRGSPPARRHLGAAGGAGTSRAGVAGHHPRALGRRRRRAARRLTRDLRLVDHRNVPCRWAAARPPTSPGSARCMNSARPRRTAPIHCAYGRTSLRISSRASTPKADRSR